MYLKRIMNHELMKQKQKIKKNINNINIFKT